MHDGQKEGNWKDLCVRLNAQLDTLHYHEHTKQFYQRWLNRIESYLNEHNISNYSSNLGIMFLKDNVDSSNWTIKMKRQVRTIINRLNELLITDTFNSKRLVADVEIPHQYAEQMKMYIRYLENAGKRASTINNYLRNGAKFFNALVTYGITDLKDVEAKHIYKAYGEDNSKTNAYPVYKSLMKFAYVEGIKDVDLSVIVPAPRIRQYIPSTYTKEETKQLLLGIDRKSWIGKRDYAIILIALRLGMRASDIVALKRENINFTKKTITFIQKKTDVAHQLALLPDVEDALLTYLNVQNKNSSFVFLRSFAPYTPLMPMSIYGIVDKHLKIANINTEGKKRGPHALRMTLASELIEEDTPYAVVQEILGHDDPDSTKHYVKFDIEKLRSCALDIPVLSGDIARILYTQGGVQ